MKQNERIAWPRVGWSILLAVLAIYAALSIRQNVLNTFLTPRAAQDLHSYWYAGHFVRQQQDPFRSTLESHEPLFPVHYLDGEVNPGPSIRQPGIATVPPNTAPYVLLLTPLALFSWPYAKAIWLVINLALMLAMPILIWRVARLYGMQIGKMAWLCVTLAFFSLFATRNAVAAYAVSDGAKQTLPRCQKWVVIGVSAVAAVVLSAPNTLFLASPLARDARWFALWRALPTLTLLLLLATAVWLFAVLYLRRSVAT